MDERIAGSVTSRISVRLAACAIVASAAWLYWQLRPPDALHAPVPWPAFVDVTVVNPGRGRLAKQTILLRGDRIEAIRPVGTADPGEVRARTFAKRYVLPGLIDLNVRQPPGFLQLERLVGLMYLSAGVTTVRDVGNFHGDLPATLNAIDSGTLVFPRLIACGRMLEGDPPRCASSRKVRDAADAVRAVEEVAAAGAQCVRVRDTLLPELATAVEAAARSRNLSRVAIPDSGGVHLPELVSLMLQTLSEESPAREPYQVFLPPIFDAVVWPAQIALFKNTATATSPRAALMQRVLAAHQARQAGVPLRVGSGAPSLYAAPGGSVRLAIEALAMTGFSREQAWEVATRGAGETLGIAQLGVIEPGAPADLLVFREDPIENAQAMATLEAVVARGRLYPSNELLGRLMQHRRYEESRIVAAWRQLQVRWHLWRDPTSVLDCQLP